MSAHNGEQGCSGSAGHQHGRGQPPGFRVPSAASAVVQPPTVAPSQTLADLTANWLKAQATLQMAQEAAAAAVAAQSTATPKQNGKTNNTRDIHIMSISERLC